MILKKLYHPLAAAAAIMLVTGLVVSSCKKKNNDDDGNNVVDPKEYAEDQLILEHIQNNADRVVYRAMTMGAAGFSNCAAVNKKDGKNGALDTMIIDFGGGSCLGWDGRYRNGRIVVAYKKDADIRDNGYYHKLIFENYSIDGFTIRGERQVTNVGTDASGHIQYGIATVDTVRKKDGTTITGASERQKVWYQGSSTPQINDDVYRLTGFGHFTLQKNGSEFTSEIRDPLVDAMDCNWIVSGVTNVYPKGAAQRVIDYGKGSCEDDATIDVNSDVTAVKIP